MNKWDDTMPSKNQIQDGRGSNQLAGVTPLGELLVAGFGTLSNISKFNAMTSGAAFNFFGPIAGQMFIITSIVFTGPINAIVKVFEASSASSVTIDKLLFQLNLGAATQMSVNFPFGGFIGVSEGEYVNANTDTSTVNMNIIGYYHPTQFNPP